MGVQIQAKIRADDAEYDGLAAISDDLITDPARPVLVVCEVVVTGYHVNLAEGGIRTPKVRLVSTEPMLDADDERTVRKIRDAAYAARTGQVAPPPSLFDPVDDETVEADADKAPEAAFSG